MLKIILKNSASLFSSQIITRLIGFGITVILSRYLGVETFGQYSFILAFVALFSITADLGISQLVIREVSKDSNASQKYLANFFVIQFFLSLVTFILIIAFINILGYESAIKNLVYIAGASTIALSVGMPFSSLINAFQKMHYSAIASIISTMIGAIAIIILVVLDQGLPLIVSVMLISNTTNSLLVYYLYRKLPISFSPPGIGWKERINVPLIKNLLKLSVPFALLMGFNTIYNRIDITMLSKMQGDMAVGYYSAAYRIVNFLSFIPLSFSAALFPVLSQKGLSDKENKEHSLSELMPQVLKYIIAIGLPVVVGVSILAQSIVSLIYGSDYIQGARALQVLVWMVAILCFYSVITHTLVAIGKVMVLALANGLGVVINISLNFIFIPRWGFVGASWATIISEAALLIASYYLAHRYMNYKEPLAAIIKTAFATAVMASAVIILQKFGVYFIISACAGAAIYFGALWITGFVSREEKQTLAKLFNRA